MLSIAISGDFIIVNISFWVLAYHTNDV